MGWELTYKLIFIQKSLPQTSDIAILHTKREPVPLRIGSLRLGLFYLRSLITNSASRTSSRSMSLGKDIFRLPVSRSEIQLCFTPDASAHCTSVSFLFLRNARICARNSLCLSSSSIYILYNRCYCSTTAIA